MYKEHEAFKKPENEDIYIWRYLDFTKFVSLLDTQALHFTRADLLADPFEGSYTKLNIPNRNQLPPEMPEDVKRKILGIMPGTYKNLRLSMMINSWHINEYESAAMWEIYLKSSDGVAIQSTFRRLTESIKSYEVEMPITGEKAEQREQEVYIGEVRYIDYNAEYIPVGNIFNPFLHKRKSFEHERELRAIAWDYNNLFKMPLASSHYDTFELEVGIDIPVELNTLIDKVFVSPSSPAWFHNLVNSIVKKYKIKKEIVQSSLADGPVY